MTEPNTLKIQAAHSGVTVSELIVDALNTADTINQAAALLGVSYRTLYRYMRELSIQCETRYFVKEVA